MEPEPGGASSGKVSKLENALKGFVSAGSTPDPATHFNTTGEAMSNPKYVDGTLLEILKEMWTTRAIAQGDVLDIEVGDGTVEKAAYVVFLGPDAHKMCEMIRTIFTAEVH